MAEFDDKLNSLLSNPDAMAQIMQLAQSLSGGQEQAAGPPPPTPPPAQPPPAAQQQAAPPFSWPTGPSGGQPPAPGPDLLSSLTGSVDPKLLTKLLPLIQELGGQQDSNARRLLYALRPYLKAERQEKIERALQLARLFHLGRKFLSGWEG